MSASLAPTLARRISELAPGGTPALHGDFGVTSMSSAHEHSKSRGKHLVSKRLLKLGEFAVLGLLSEQRSTVHKADPYFGSRCGGMLPSPNVATNSFGG